MHLLSLIVSGDFKVPSLTLVRPSSIGLNHLESAYKLILQTQSATAFHGAYLSGLRQLSYGKVSWEFRVNSVNRAFIFNQWYFSNSGTECFHLLTLVIITSLESNTIKLVLRALIITQQLRRTSSLQVSIFDFHLTLNNS